MYISFDSIDPSSTTRDVTLAGTPEQVETARTEIERLVEAQASGQKVPELWLLADVV